MPITITVIVSPSGLSISGTKTTGNSDIVTATCDGATVAQTAAAIADGPYSLSVPLPAPGAHTIAVSAHAVDPSATMAITVAAPSAAMPWATPGVGSFTDVAGNTYSIDATGHARENGAAIPGGSDTAALTLSGGTLYGQDAGGSGWYTWSGGAWRHVTAAPPAPPGSPQPPTPPAPPAPPAPPPTSGGVVTVSVGSPTGKMFTAGLAGFATGALTLNNFAALNDQRVIASLTQIKPTALRLNAYIGGSGTDIGPLMAALPKFSPNCEIIAGFDQNIAPDAAAAWLSTQLARGYPIRRVEIGNEPNNVDAYCNAFNAIADALHAVAPSLVVIGPIGSWFDALDLRTFANRCGSRCGAVCFHSYPIGDPSASNVSIYNTADALDDVQKARTLLSGTPLAAAPLILGEYGLNGNNNGGTWGIPQQASGIMVVYMGRMITRYFQSDPLFTDTWIWDIDLDSYYGVIASAASGGNPSVITPAGVLLGYVGQNMAGAEIGMSIGLPGVVGVATMVGKQLAIWLTAREGQGGTFTLAANGASVAGPMTVSQVGVGMTGGSVTTVAAGAPISLAAESSMVVVAPLV